MIDKNKKIMLLIVDPMGNIDSNYFEDHPRELHHQIMRNYINSKVIDFSLKYDLTLLDKQAKEKGYGIEKNLYNLEQIFLKNGYMIIHDATDYRQYFEGEKHSGHISLPANLDDLSDIHKQILNQLSTEVIVDKVCKYKNIDKIVYFDLPVFCYNQALKEVDKEGQNFNEVIYELNNQSKRIK